MKHKFRRGMMSIVMALALVISAFTGVMPLQSITASADVDYLTFTAEENGSSVKINWLNSSFSLEYYNGNGWEAYSKDTTIPLNQDEYVKFRGINDNISGSIFDESKHVEIGGSVACTGNIMTILNYENTGEASMSYACFSNMFLNCTGLTTAPELPAETLASKCYFRMFEGCTSLTEAPELSATTLADNCYDKMFFNCESLTNAPELPAMKLTFGCYFNMFYGCINLTKVPELPATDLAEYCYNSMFMGCTSLTELPELPAKELKDNCYSAMFFGCDGIKVSNERDDDYYNSAYRIPASGTGTTAKAALSWMFVGTSGSVQEPEINKTYYVHKYTHFKAVEPTCTTAGNIEYYTYGDKYYTYNNETYTELTDQNGDNVVDINDTIIPAAHDYKETWSWVKTATGYDVTLLYKCAKCGAFEEVKATVESEPDGNMTRYTATAKIGDDTFTSTQEIEDKFTVTVSGGTIIAGEKNTYSYNDAITVKADELDGFSGWYIGDTLITRNKTHVFCINSNVNITAKYNVAVQTNNAADVSILINRQNLTDGSGNQKITLSVNWALPSGCKLKEAGIVRRYESSENLTLNGEGVTINKSKLKTRNGNFNYIYNLRAASVNKSINAVAYVTYTNTAGQDVTEYSETVVS